MPASPLDQARRWWKQQVEAHRYVISPAEAPSAAVVRVLRHAGLVMEVAGRRAWILTPERAVERRGVFLANYWPVVALVLRRYAPAAILGVGAIKLQLEDFSPLEELAACHGANRSEYALSMEPGFVLRLRPREVTAASVESIRAPGDVDIPVLSPADILATLDEREIAANLEQVSVWLRHLVIRTPELERASGENPKPVILQRLADMSAMLRNESLAKQLDAEARRISARTTSPSRTGVGTRIQVPQILQLAPRGSGSPWLDEQAMRLARQEAEVVESIGSKAGALDTFNWRTLRASAELGKAYDAYHSMTMEGYRIGRETSDAIIRGEPLPGGPQDQKAREASMAVQGYSLAFNEVLVRA